jgi:hypothetical protein
MWRLLTLGCAALFIAGCSGNSGTSSGSSGSGSSAGSGSTGSGSTGSGGSSGGGTQACAETTAVARLPACGAPASSNVGVPSGCVPTVDGALHVEEWNGATCFNIGSNGDVMYAKYAGDSLYLAFSATPACGCGISFSFDPDDAASLNEDEFSVSLADDPFGTDGDRADFVYQGGSWKAGAAPAGIVTASPGNQPSPVNFEWKIPLSALGITPGSAHAFHLAVNHPNGGTWPAGVSISSSSNFPDNPSNWGEISSPTNWR